MTAEVLEVFLFPLWRDAGLVALKYDAKKRRESPYPKRSTQRPWGGSVNGYWSETVPKKPKASPFEY